MSSFRHYSDRYPFRHRSETPSIAVELSLQPYRAFSTDAVILFSDILTPFPALGLSFDMHAGRGPLIATPVRELSHVRALERTPFQPEEQLGFVAEVLERLKTQLIGEDVALMGFVGAPFTLAAYAVEGGGVKNLLATKRLMYGGVDGSDLLHRLMDRFALVVAQYALFQIAHGAQVVQFFDSWAHHLSPQQYARFALPYARKAVEIVKKERPQVPVIFFANGVGGKLEMIRQALGSIVDVISVDWSVSMRDARRRLGRDTVLQGNVDPSILTVGSDDAIREAVRETVEQAEGKLILNLGHGVIKETPERAVQVFCEAARSVTMAGVAS